MIEGHQDGPVAAAVLETPEAPDENAFGAACFITGINERPDRRPFLFESGDKPLPISDAALETEKEATDKKFDCRKSGPGGGEGRFGWRGHDDDYHSETLAKCK